MRTQRRKSAPKKLAPIPARPIPPIVVAPAFPSVNDAPLLKVDEVARVLRVTERTVYAYINAGILKRVKIGNQTSRITSASLQKLMTPA
jgi:excisionase family DNA binding protein